MSISGQLFVRDQGKGRDGRRMVMVVGVIAVPDDIAMPDGHQLTATGYKIADDAWRLTLLGGAHAVDRKEEARGWGADNLLTEPIWRV